MFVLKSTEHTIIAISTHYPWSPVNTYFQLTTTDDKLCKKPIFQQLKTLKAIAQFNIS